VKPSDRQVALGGRGLFDPVTSTRLLSTTELVAMAVLTPVLNDIEERMLERIAVLSEQLMSEDRELMTDAELQAWHEALNLVRGGS
jgi:hypothetical protein